MNPFEAHAAAVAALQGSFGGGDAQNGARLLILQRNIGCTHSPVVYDAELMAGISPRLMIEQCEFLADDVGTVRLRKYEKCQLILRPGEEPLRLQLWDGGLLTGGLVYRFRLVDENFRA